ncbi:MAG: hypothetical protein KDC99_12340 [Cyclobacteriaceae bacterium]|nr:hypothetical protein [Cyclobacteriaceae bacterium]
MIRSVAAVFLSIGVCLSVFGQETTTKKVTRINLPGSFLVDIGVNRGLSAPRDFDTGFWGSRTLNLYYQYPIRIAHSNFSLVPGMGLGFERFKMTNNYTLTSKPGADGTYGLVLADTSILYPGTKKSMIVANYFDIPVELRFDSRPDDISRSFNLAVGGRFGVLLDSFTKIKYKQDGETKIVKDKQDHGLNDIRYGFYTRIGIGGFNWFFMYNSSSLFKTDEGPNKTVMNTFTAGISINGF